MMVRSGRGSALRLLLCALLSLSSEVSAAASSTCSARAIASWESKCAVRTASNEALVPLTSMSASTINVDGSDLADTYNAARVTALKLSATAGNAAIARLRKKTTSWYEASLTKIMTFVCAETLSTAELERCVNKTSEEAALDINGSCIQLTDDSSCYSQGLCERQANCKWDDPVAGAASRHEMFTAANVTTANSWMSTGYPKSFAGFVAPGIVLAVLLSLAFVGFIVLRCVFNQCGGRSPDEKGYSRCDLIVPSVIFVACSLAVFICAVFTVAQNTNISDGVSGVLDSLNITLENIEIFTANLETPMLAANVKLTTATNEVTSELSNVTWIATEGQQLRDMVAAFYNEYAPQGPFPSSTCNKSSASCVSCPNSVCGTPLKAFFTSAVTAINGTSGIVETSVELLQDTFMNKSTSISTHLKAALLELTTVAAMATKSQSSVEVIKTTFDDYSFSRGALVMSVFLLGMLASFIGLFAIYKGVCAKQSMWVHLLHVSWSLSVLVAILGFVLSASLLAVSAVFYDSCKYMNIAHNNLTSYVPTNMATIGNTCFNDSSLLAPLELDQALKFSCELDDSYATMTATNFNAYLALINSYGDTVSNFEVKDFGFNSTISRQLLTKAKTAISDAGTSGSTTMTQDNIMTPWTTYTSASASSYDCSSKNLTSDNIPICFMNATCDTSTKTSTVVATCKSAYINAYNYVLAFDKISTMLDEMREDLLGDTGKGFSSSWAYDVSILEYAQTYYTKLASLRSDTLVPLLKSGGSVGSLLEDIEQVRCTESCGWLNIAFNAVHDSMCTDILGTTLAISLAVFFLAVFLLPMVVTGITLQKRLRGAKKGTYEQLEKRLQMLEARSKEAAKAGDNGSKKKFDFSKIVRSEGS